jgi:hypothetical protein
MDTVSTKRLLGSWDDAVDGAMVEAVAWFDFDGGLRVLVADYDNGRRIIVRTGSRGSTKIQFERTALQASEAGR